MAQKIYCDEGGFTGNDMLNIDQPFFTYASVAIEPELATELATKAIADFRIDGAELKGSRILGHNKGRLAACWIAQQVGPHSLVSAHHKKYCLATKFFEYVFEPVLAEQNSIFYNIGFHRFIANLLYFEALQSSSTAISALDAFQALARRQPNSLVTNLFPKLIVEPGYSEVLEDIAEFVRIHSDFIAAEFAKMSVLQPVHRWMLELSSSALYSLLATWGSRFDSLEVYCDDSKPLVDMREPFDMMVGRTDKGEIAFEGKRQSLVFNLAKPIEFVSSANHPGIQLADVLAATLAFVLKNPSDSQSARLYSAIKPAMSQFSIFPDSDRVALNTQSGFVNCMVLHELVERGRRRVNPFEGMPEFIREANRTWQRNRAYFEPPDF